MPIKFQKKMKQNTFIIVGCIAVDRQGRTCTQSQEKAAGDPKGKRSPNNSI